MGEGALGASVDHILPRFVVEVEALLEKDRFPPANPDPLALADLLLPICTKVGWRTGALGRAGVGLGGVGIIGGAITGSGGEPVGG